MKISTITGHLTATNKKHVKALFGANLKKAKVNTIKYFLTVENDIYTVKTAQKEYGQIIYLKATFKTN